jgi:molybdopterin-containing oxidoreductase family iron-sulfur binding subunit
MTIDLNLCTGCGACTAACAAENNIPWVGEERVEQGREMSWIAIARYYKETEDGGFRTLHAPMLCQHCGDAPCEPVCPVYATYHNPEGLNAQVYNRCVGTRYCANNCPYKVRRFNWYTYPIGEDTKFGDWPYPLNLQLNPDVTVRSKGVMERCSFCVQRINRAKYLAKDRGRQIGDGDVVSACMQTCPTDAIVFGNLKDPESRVSEVARGARGYLALDELSTRPAITYLKGVTHAELEDGSRGGGSGHA